MEIVDRQMSGTDILYERYSKEEASELADLISKEIYLTKGIEWERLYYTMKSAHPETLQYRWSKELEICKVERNLWVLLFQTPLEDVPLWINEDKIGPVAAWRLRIAK